MRPSRPLTIVVALLAATAVLAACGSSSKKSSGTSTTTAANSGASNASAVGVTPTEIKLGVALVDFSCVRNFTDTIRENQDQVYNAYINDINEKGGIDGRKIVPFFESYCPVGSSGPLNVCTKLTEDDKVFAVLGKIGRASCRERV